MPYCFVPFCRSGSKKFKDECIAEGQPPPSFHTPKTEEMRKLWSVKVGRQVQGNSSKILEMKPSDRICSRHFSESEVIRFYEHKLPDGSVCRIPRGSADLKAGAVPTIFNDYPPRKQPKQKKERKDPSERQRSLANQSKKKPRGKNEQNSEKYSKDSEDNQGGDSQPHEYVPEAGPSEETDETPNNENRVWELSDINKLVLPVGWIACNTLQNKDGVLGHINNETLQLDKTIAFKSGSVEIYIKGVPFKNAAKSIETFQAAQNLVNLVDSLRICEGTGRKDKLYSVACSGATTTSKQRKCSQCISERDRLRKKDGRKLKLTQRQAEKKKKLNSRLKSLTKSKKRLQEKIQKMKRKLEECQKKCKEVKKETLEAAIKDLPESQQEAVRACFDAAKKKGVSGRRYSISWVYECLMMRVKSHRLYKHIQENNILPVPCQTTLSSYMKNMGGGFGFQTVTLKLIEKKVAEWEESERRGVILIDEMKLTAGVKFNKETLSVEGIKQLENNEVDPQPEDWEENPDDPQSDETRPPAKKKRERRKKHQSKSDAHKEHAKNKMAKFGDHALVISFQPFKGKWVQAVACFLTRGNANATTLTHLILEAVTLLEEHGLRVDGVVTDGASWNRSMWKKFGVSVENPRANHPCDTERKLWFFSDFPHLMKCMRNCMVTHKIIETPKGNVDLKHWKAVVDEDSKRGPGLKECPRLTETHLAPDFWQKMNVAMAWQFWSGSAAAGMQSYKEQGIEELQDCQVTVDFVKLVNDTADVMNTNTPKNALKPNSPQFELIQKFLKEFQSLKVYANEMMQMRLQRAREAVQKCQKSTSNQNAPQRGRKRKATTPQLPKEPTEAYVFSESTDTGLLISLQATLELISFLNDKCGYAYLMTRRLNQDALERFFGLVRQSAGQNTHPEPKVFAQLFRLLSLYSLVKPTKGSNITGGEMLQALLDLKDFKDRKPEEKHEALTKKLDEIIQKGDNMEQISDLVHELDHTYRGDMAVDEFALHYVGGFTARHCEKFVKKCEDCRTCLKKDKKDCNEKDKLIVLKTKGYLTFPSDSLMNLLQVLESELLRTYKNKDLCENFIFHVMERLDTVKVPTVGCPHHKNEVTKAVMKFYIIMRMHFFCKEWNKENSKAKKDVKKYKKQAHLA